MWGMDVLGERCEFEIIYNLLFRQTGVMLVSAVSSAFTLL